MMGAIRRSYSLVLYFVILAVLGFIGDPNGDSLHLFSGTTFYVLAIITGLIFYYWLVYSKATMPQMASDVVTTTQNTCESIS
jgi:hypothetical protein